MPTYAYRCRDCGHQFDIFQKFSEDALTVCPACQGTIRRVIQPTGVVFKGTGFYINDSRNSAKTGSDPAKTGADAGGTSAGDQASNDQAGNSTDKPAAQSGAGATTSSEKTESGKAAPAKEPAGKQKVAAAPASDR